MSEDRALTVVFRISDDKKFKPLSDKLHEALLGDERKEYEFGFTVTGLSADDEIARIHAIEDALRGHDDPQGAVESLVTTADLTKEIAEVKAEIEAANA